MKKKYYPKSRPHAPVHKRKSGKKAPTPHERECECEGIFSGARGGYGFVSREEGDDIFIPAGKTAGALDGDRVTVSYRNRYEGKTEGRVTAITEKGKRTLVGVLAAERSRGSRARTLRWYVIPDSRHYPEEIPVTDRADAESGDRVEVKLIFIHGALAAEVTRSFGVAGSVGAVYASVLAECGIEPEFSAEELAEAEKRAAEPLCDAGRTRVGVPVLTIDGADAKDLDDAVSLQKNGDGYLLGVHIADVSEYVRPKTALDRAAMRRGTSVYFVDQVVPMLPPALSNGACSLNAGEDKYVLSAYLSLDESGALRGCRLAKEILCSDVRGVYSEVNDLFTNGRKSAYAAKYEKVLPTLILMRELYEKLDARARIRGMLELESPEPYFLLDENGMPTEILRRTRGDAEKMIEQFMLTANEGVATLLAEKKIPCVYRVHETPPEDKFTDFVRYAYGLGLHVSALSARPVTAAALSGLLTEAAEKNKSRAVGYPLLRAMAKAHYSENCAPHFGLGIARYCHFTSPIRRLSDLATHRMIKAVLLDGEDGGRYTAYARRAAAAASETELSAMNAERQIDALYTALWAEGHIGEEYDAFISSNVSFGIFAELDNTCEGLIPFDALPFGAVYEEDTRIWRIGNEVFRMADPLRIRISGASVGARRVYFSLVSHTTAENEENEV